MFIEGMQSLNEASYLYVVLIHCILNQKKYEQSIDVRI